MAAEFQDFSDPIIELELLDFINTAFEECARAQQVLQQKVQNSILAFCKQHGQGDSQLGSSFAHEIRYTEKLEAPREFFTVPLRPQVTLSFPVHDQCRDSSTSMPKSHRAEAIKGNGPRSSPAVVQPFNGPDGDEDASDKSGIGGEVLAKKLNSRYGSETDFAPSNSLNPIHSISLASAFHSRQSRLSSRQSTSFGIFVTCLGRFASVNNINELPNWIRLAEKIRHSDPTKVPMLHDVWIGAIYGDGVDVCDVVQACQKANFLKTLTKAYLQIQKTGSARSMARSSRRLSTADTTQLFYIMLKNTMVRAWRSTSHTFPLHPNSGLRLSWDAISLAICFYDMIVLPMVAFDFGEQAQKMRDTLQLIATVFWTLDILLSFCTGYFDGFAIQRTYRKIAISYARTWLLMDLTIIVNDWLTVILAGTYAVGFRGGAKTTKSLMRCVRLVRLWKISSNFLSTLKLMHSQFSLTALKISLYTLLVVVICHYVACGFYALHTLRGLTNTWVKEFIPPDATPEFLYFTSLHWALTQLLPASMQVYPVNMPERIYNIGFVIIAMVLSAFYTSSIIVSMNHLRSTQAQAIERDNQLRMFLAQHEVSPAVSRAIWSFMSKRTRSVPPKMKPADVVAFKGLPEHILEKVYEEAFSRHLQAHPLFDFYSKVEPRCMTKLCRMGVEQFTLLSCEVLWHDLLVSKMLFVRHGHLEYDDGTFENALVVEPGEWCCEEALWGRRACISAPFLAGVAGCELLMVDPDVFQCVAQSFARTSHSFVFLARYGEEFIRRFSHASHDYSCADVLFNFRENMDHMLRSVLGSMQNHGGSMVDHDDSSQSSSENALQI